MHSRVTEPAVHDRTRSAGLTVVEVLVVIAIMAILSGLALSAVQRARETAVRAECGNKLRQLGVAAHNYHAMHLILPPGVGSRNTPTPYMSWITRLLPHLEQQPLWQIAEQAYRQDPNPFDNPPHTPLDTVLPVLNCPADGRVLQPQTSRGYRAAFTCYLGVSGIDKDRHDGVLFSDSRIRLGDVTDGTSHTLMAGERPPSSDFFFGWWYAGAGLNGTGTCDMILGVREPFAGGLFGVSCAPDPVGFVPGRVDEPCDVLHFWSLHYGGAHFLFADGSVRFLAYSADPILPALATRAGGETVELP
jgi:prepilin-type processing-associated H-X9-DG protein